MNIALQIVQILLGFMFLTAGLMKAFNYAKAKESLPQVKDVPKGRVTSVWTPDKAYSMQNNQKKYYQGL